MEWRWYQHVLRIAKRKWPRLWNQLPDSFCQPRVLDLIYLLQIHHFSWSCHILAYQFQYHHSLFHHPRTLFILASKHFFFINPTVHRPLVPSGLISRITWFTWMFFGFPYSTVLFLFHFFRFQFSKSFSSSVIFSSLFLCTFIYPIIAFFLGESTALSSFFQFSVFHKLLVLMR